MKKVLIAERGAFLPQDIARLYELGFEVVWCYTHSIDSIKSASDVPLRDYFAAAALMAMDVQITVSEPAAQKMAYSAFVIADAMLAERAKSDA